MEGLHQGIISFLGTTSTQIPPPPSSSPPPPPQIPSETFTICRAVPMVFDDLKAKPSSSARVTFSLFSFFFWLRNFSIINYQKVLGFWFLIFGIIFILIQIIYKFINWVSLTRYEEPPHHEFTDFNAILTTFLLPFLSSQPNLFLLFLKFRR